MMTNRIKQIMLGCVIVAGIASAADVVIRIAPPRPVHVGAIGRAPGPGFVWVEGYHEYRGKAYVWVPGRWERPPRPRAVWVAPSYKKVRDGWVYAPGHWR